MKNQHIKQCGLDATPISIFEKCRSLFKDSALLESFGEDRDTSSFTIIGVIANEKVIAKDDACILFDKNGQKIKEIDWTEVLDSWVNLSMASGASIQLGTIGYVGYENNAKFERLDTTIASDNDLADTYLVNYSLMLWFDKKTNETFWVYDDSLSSEDIEQLEAKLKLDINPDNKPFAILGDSVADYDEQEYYRIIEKTREYIRSGDIFQANITMRYHVQCGGDPFDLYQELCAQTPNPFMAFLDFEHPIISTSPERYFKIDDGIISANPIKGTLKFNADNEEQMYQQLYSSAKDRAENTMIVDLMRNDLGRICQHGSVSVPKLCAIKKFNNLFHYESIVKGNLQPSVSISDVFKASFPGGSITGAPKVRAMEVIDELEYKKRKVYCGAIGFFGQHGYIDTSIAIRTMYVVDNILYYHGGGGIVIDSQPQSELEELKAKVSKIESSINEFNILGNHRKRLDKLDQNLLNIFGERFQIIREVSEIKSQHDIPILQSRRVEQMIETRVDVGEKEHDLSGHFVEELFHLIINHSMEAESKLS